MIDLGDTVPLGVTITDGAGAPVPATSITLTITRPDGTIEPGTSPSNPSTGRYTFDYVPAIAGLHAVRWASTGPAAAYVDAIDVRAATRNVISLTDARLYLNKLGAGAVDEDELRTMIAAAVGRVDRHLGRSLLDATSVTESEVLAVKAVLAEFWRTQRSRFGGRSNVGMPTTAAAIDLDAGPAGGASLRAKLTDLLGEPAASGGGVAAPTGSFPSPCEWPDPAARVRW